MFTWASVHRWLQDGLCGDESAGDADVCHHAQGEAGGANSGVDLATSDGTQAAVMAQSAIYQPHGAAAAVVPYSRIDARAPPAADAGTTEPISLLRSGLAVPAATAEACRTQAALHAPLASPSEIVRCQTVLLPLPGPELMLLQTSATPFGDVLQGSAHRHDAEQDGGIRSHPINVEVRSAETAVSPRFGLVCL